MRTTKRRTTRREANSCSFPGPTRWWWARAASWDSVSGAGDGEKRLSTVHRALRTEHRAPSTEHRAPSTEHRAPSTEHRASSIEHRASNTRAVTVLWPGCGAAAATRGDLSHMCNRWNGPRERSPLPFVCPGVWSVEPGESIGYAPYIHEKYG